MKSFETRAFSFKGYITEVNPNVKELDITRKEFVDIKVKETDEEGNVTVYDCNYVLEDFDGNELDLPKIGDYVHVSGTYNSEGEILSAYARLTKKLQKLGKHIMNNSRSMEEQAEYAEQVKASIEERKSKRLAAIEAARNLAAQHI